MPGLALGAGLVLGLFHGAGLAQVKVKVPPDFALEKAETSPGQVTFSHGKHLANGERCTTCHYRTFKMRRGGSPPVTLAAKTEGKACASCHDGQPKRRGVVAFPVEECDRCHVP
jgi:c(7)-type cytochrome triheme protein